MDETEVQVEIACWAQGHPEVERINWQGENEPWVSFPGKLCTMHVGLGGLVWSIGVPTGYQTELDTDGSRKRCWDPFDLHDTVIVPDINTPFRVSVLYPKNSGVEGTRFLVQQPGYDYQDAQDSLINLLQQLQVSDDTSGSTSKQEQRLLMTSKACFQAMNKAETLSEVLDAIHALKTFYRLDDAASLSTCADLAELQSMFSMGSQSNVGNGESEDDLFAPELAYKWSWIKAQVEYAADACRIARNSIESGVTDPDSSNEQVVTMMEEMEDLEIADIRTVSFKSRMLVDFDCESSERIDDYAYVRGTSSNRSRNYSDTLNGRRSISRSNSDSGLSVDTDDSWEDVADMSEVVDTNFLDDSEEAGIQTQFLPKNKRKFHQVYAPAEGGGGGRGKAEAEAGAALTEDILPGSTTTCHEEAPKDRFGGPEKVLQYCDISFNAASFSVECAINLDKFMHNNTAPLTAMGLFLEHPLRVEIVPNKEQVDALAWTGLVEVYVTQQSEWHSHISEEVCGLLCFVPHIVRHYFQVNVFGNLRHPPTPDSRGELFIGLLETVVRRLASVSRDNCCVCWGPLDELSRTFVSRILWPCEDNMCQALYASWQAVSSYDADERARQEQVSLAVVEKDLREDFPYSERILDNLTCALAVYNVNTDGLHYGQMIRALAQIELWNRRDLGQL